MRIAPVVASLIALSAGMYAQTKTTGKAETSGSCSPAVSGNHNTLNIDCNHSDASLDAYDISGKRGVTFETLLNTQTETRDTVRVGCIDWMPDSCVTAGKFLLSFSRAGWKIDENRVFRLDTRIPPEGITIASKTPKYTDNLPPHLGHWNQMDTSQITFWTAFQWVQVPIGATGDPDMPVGTIGIYFGANPKNVKARTSRGSRELLLQLVGIEMINLKVLEQACADDIEACKTRTTQATNIFTVLLARCECGISESWSKKWNGIAVSSQSNDDQVKLVNQRYRVLQQFTNALTEPNSKAKKP
jgi:hypothetical protein